MKLSRLFVVSSAFLGMSTTAHAGKLASGNLYAGAAQVFAACYVRNVGSSPIPPPDLKIYDTDGNQKPLSLNTCTNFLQPEQACVVATDSIRNDRAHGCTANVAVSSKKLGDTVRGSFDVRRSDGIIQSEILR
jgi:hypothetical protein